MDSETSWRRSHPDNSKTNSTAASAFFVLNLPSSYA
jgi:hypothetical protein